ncbi:MAG: hypothetical protein WAK82_20655 [Streptosporangiaceae bacterium]
MSPPACHCDEPGGRQTLTHESLTHESPGVQRPEQRQAEHRRNRLEKRYRRLLALYPRDHRREHAEEMVGVLLAVAAHDVTARDGSPRTWRPAAAAARLGRDIADGTDLIAGAARIHGRMALSRIRPRWFSCLVRDPRWSDALGVLSVIAPLLLLVAALADFGIPQAVASAAAGHPDWRITATYEVSDLPLLVGASIVTVLTCLRHRQLAGMAALATGIGQLAVGVPGSALAFRGYSSPAVAFTVLLAGTAAAALLLSPGPSRGLDLLTFWGAALVTTGALILGGFSVGTSAWFGYTSAPPPSLTSLSGEVAGLPADLLIAGVLVAVAAACLRTPVSRRVLALLAIPVIPYAVMWQEKLAVDMLGPLDGSSAVIHSSVPLLYVPPLLVACLIIAGTQLARRRATGHEQAKGPGGQMGSASSPGPPGAVSA